MTVCVPAVLLISERKYARPIPGKVAIARAIEEELAGRRGSNQYKKKELSPDGDKATGRSDEIAAKRAGFGGKRSYLDAKRVVDKGVHELAEAMDAGARPQI